MTIIDDLNFALPGLQEMAAPISDALKPTIVLPVHVQGSPWNALPISYSTITNQPPSHSAESATISFYHFSDTDLTPHLTSDVTVIDGIEWIFEVPAMSAETFNLTPGLWTWVLWVNSDGLSVAAVSGQLTVRHAV